MRLAKKRIRVKVKGSGFSATSGRGGCEVRSTENSEVSREQSVTRIEAVTLLPLTQEERDQFGECEEILRAGLHTFFDVGSALLTIRHGRLYRATHATFENYCRDRWGIGRSYAWRVIAAAERLKLLPVNEDIPRPSNEFQIRPFLKLQAEQFPKAWQQAIRRA